jgi:peptide/nickel transport system substrate-binding protein
MNEVGFTKDREGIFADASGQRYRTELRYSAGPEWERRTAILSDGYRTAGILADPYPLPAEAGRSREVRAQFPGFASRGGGMSEMNFTGDEVASPSNRWGGSNRSGWSNPEYDRVYQTFATTLNRTERLQHFATMQRLLTEQLPVFTFHFYVEVNAHVAELTGPTDEIPQIGTVSLAPTVHSNIHEWQWR